ncbi:TIR domain-containing protein [Haliangium sp. UPWRP_2]|uniref:TIR domain-containing protein n=1 Tax=Haliangium sp. UPWRP_2 TaxID=1931276 RepID=UPI000B543D03|nr:TIR domain-containing protein [Haliangium sp. UPWRP_2]PSM31873.1 TIR domain-containing protein [Haliangium sp. UPWRP_2]
MTTDYANRHELLSRLLALLPAQFEEILFRLRIPVAHLSGPAAPQSLRAVETIRYLEESGRLAELVTLVTGTNSWGTIRHSADTPVRLTQGAGTETLRCFISYAERDRGLMEELRMRLAPLQRTGEIKIWDASQLQAGVSVQGVITSELNRSDLILFLVSADFLFADHLLDLTTVAMDRHKRGLSRVVPILLRPCDWSDSPMGHLQMLPKDGRALTARQDRDAAWVDVISGLRLLIKDLRASSTVRRTSVADVQPEATPTVHVRGTESVPRPVERRSIGEIFRTSGTPVETFVEPDRFGRLRIALNTMGKGLVVEGPSGIGKSVAVKKALEELGQKEKYTILSGVYPPDLEKLEKLLSKPIQGHVIVDDFHRLTDAAKARLANIMKYLADGDQHDAKLTLIGVNRAGMSLTSELPDLAGRVDIFAMGRQPDRKIEQLIDRGERAANLSFVRRAEYVLAALGSFYTIQQLCLRAAAHSGIEEIPGRLTAIEATPRDILPEIMEELERRFRGPMLAFATLDKTQHRRGACIMLLWLIRQEQRGCILLDEARYQFPEMSQALDALISDNLLLRMARIPTLNDILFYDTRTNLLSIEDPRLEFYLRNLSFEEFGRAAGIPVRIGAEEQLTFPA